MTPPRPEDQPPACPEDRIDLLADAPPPLRREVPVRPKELDLPRPAEPEPPAAGSAPAPTVIRPPDAPAATARSMPAEEAADGPVLCPRCKYDLRGRPGGARCPECGTLIQGRVRIALKPGERRTARDTLFDAWQRFSGSSLVSIIVVSPLVYALPLGVAIASCAGFGAAFRLFALREFALLPGPLREPVDRSLALWRKLELAQIAIAVLITIGGLLSTIGVLGPGAIPFYYFALTAWWALAAGALFIQLRVGDRLSQLLVDASVLPLEVVPKLVRWLQATAIAGVIAGVLATYSAIRLPGAGLLPYAGTVANAASLILLGAMVAQIIVAIHARAHAVLVANCFFESDYFRANPNRGKQERDDGENPNAVPPSKRHSFTPKGDDAPIRLPGE